MVRGLKEGEEELGWMEGRGLRCVEVGEWEGELE